MTETYEIVAIGAGHNALTAAAYLAKAGKKVRVLEKNPWWGGGVVTREVTLPGFRHDTHATGHSMILANPLIAQDELGLQAKYGLSYVNPDQPWSSVFEDGRVLCFFRDRHKNAEQIAKFSHRDAEAYLRFCELTRSFLPVFLASLYTPPPPNGAMLAMLDQSDAGRLIFRALQMSAWDLLSEWFENDCVKLHFMKVISENFAGPEEKGTALGLFVFVGFMEEYGIATPRGGSGKLSDALVACIEANGGTIETNQEVTRVLVSGGRAVGVRLHDGREIRATDAVIGSIHPHLLRRYIESVDPQVARDAENTQVAMFSILSIHAALNAPLEYRAGPEVANGYIIELLHTDMLKTRRSFDALRYGEIPEQLLLAIVSPSVFDPTRAPPGKALMWGGSFLPFHLAAGGSRRWEEIGEQVADRIIEAMREYVINLDAGNILARTVDTPLDMVRDSDSFQQGDVHGLAPYFHQFGSHRPTPALGQYTVPGLAGFYLVGPAQHPGGGVFGAGRGTAMKMFDDLKMDFDKVAGGKG
ncbi:MAG TPA: NAD(P)/FAD-dependent oxidoreductase [Steroidobacteraceae bacterium]|nr:NAD(P)/FAD-dependent oxidoreductase [Steroidobacteraceae bacterium]